MQNVINTLEEVSRRGDTKKVAKVFRAAMRNKGAIAGNYKTKRMHYSISGKENLWNKVEYYFYRIGGEGSSLEFVYRNQNGNYLYVAQYGKRAYEISRGNVIVYSESLLKKISSEYSEFFIMLKQSLV